MGREPFHRLLQVVAEVQGGFKSYGETDQPVRDTPPHSLFRRHGGMGHGGRVGEYALYASKAHCHEGQLDAPQHLLRGLAVFQFEGDYRASSRSLPEVYVPAGVRGEGGIIDVFYLRAPEEPLCDDFSAFLLRFHSCREGLDPSEKEPGVLRPQD